MELNLVQETSVGCHLLKCTRLHILGPGMKDSSPGDVRLLLCSKGCPRGWGEGPTQQVYLGTPSHLGLFWEAVLCSSKVLLDVLSQFFSRKPEERCKCLAKSWSRRGAL